MTEDDLIDIEARTVQLRRRNMMGLGAYLDTVNLIAEVRKLRGQLHDAGLPDANDFPHPHGGIL
jgi:hypothetical protein